MTKLRFTVFVHLRALPAWLALPRDHRGEIAAIALGAALEGQSVTHRHFDAEAFSAFCSDIAVFEADDPIAFYGVMERLRDSPLFAKPYFELVEIIPTLEDGYRHFERSAA